MINLKFKISKRFVFVVILIIAIIIVEQIIKICAINFIRDNPITVIEGILKLQYAENTGAAFSMGYNNTTSIIITNVIVLGLIIRFMILQRERMDKKTTLLLSFILAGGMSNLIDRIFRGFVVDYIVLLPNITCTILNIADILLVLSWIGLAAVFAWNTYKELKIKN